MRDLPVELVNYLQLYDGVVIRQFIWIVARNRNDASPEPIGFWSGDDDQAFVVEGEERVYHGRGQFVRLGDLMLENTLNIRKFTAKVSPITPEMETVLRTYDPKFARVQVHLGFFNPETNNLVAPPLRVHKGWVNTFPITTPALGEQSSGTLEMVGHTRILTKTLPAKRSDESQRARSPGDTFMQDVGMSGQVITPWGSKDTGGSGGLIANIAAGIAGA